MRIAAHGPQNCRHQPLDGRGVRPPRPASPSARWCAALPVGMAPARRVPPHLMRACRCACHLRPSGVAAVQSGLGALELLRRGMHPFDLLGIGHLMPKLSGALAKLLGTWHTWYGTTAGAWCGTFAKAPPQACGSEAPQRAYSAPVGRAAWHQDAARSRSSCKAPRRSCRHAACVVWCGVAGACTLMQRAYSPRCWSYVAAHAVGVGHMLLRTRCWSYVAAHAVGHMLLRTLLVICCCAHAVGHMLLRTRWGTHACTYKESSIVLVESCAQAAEGCWGLCECVCLPCLLPVVHCPGAPCLLSPLLPTQHSFPGLRPMHVAAPQQCPVTYAPLSSMGFPQQCPATYAPLSSMGFSQQCPATDAPLSSMGFAQQCPVIYGLCSTVPCHLCAPSALRCMLPGSQPSVASRCKCPPTCTLPTARLPAAYNNPENHNRDRNAHVAMFCWLIRIIPFTKPDQWGGNCKPLDLLPT